MFHASLSLFSVLFLCLLGLRARMLIIRDPKTSPNKSVLQARAPMKHSVISLYLQPLDPRPRWSRPNPTRTRGKPRQHVIKNI